MTNDALRFSILIIVLLLTIFPAAAQFPENIDLRFTAETGTLTVGDVASLTLQATYPADYRMTVPALPEQWGDFEIRGQSEAETTLNDDGTQTTTQTIEVTVFDVGTFSTPGFPVAFTDPNGETLERAVPQISLTVESVLEEGDTDLRDIKPQAELPVPPVWPWILGGLLPAALLGWGGWWLVHYLRRRFQPQPSIVAPEPFIDPRPAHQIALEELDRIENLHLPGQGRFKEFYTLISDCQRRYLEGAYGLPAMDLTTDEIRRALKQTGLGWERTRDFTDLFSACDLVKFARLIPSRAEARAMLPQARALVIVPETATNNDLRVTSDE